MLTKFWNLSSIPNKSFHMNWLWKELHNYRQTDTQRVIQRWCRLKTEPHILMIPIWSNPRISTTFSRDLLATLHLNLLWWFCVWFVAAVEKIRSLLVLSSAVLVPTLEIMQAVICLPAVALPLPAGSVRGAGAPPRGSFLTDSSQHHCESSGQHCGCCFCSWSYCKSHFWHFLWSYWRDFLWLCYRDFL